MCSSHVRPVFAHEFAQAERHRFAYFASVSHIQHKSRVARRQPAKFGRGQFGFAQETFDEPIDVDFRFSESIGTNIEHT